MAYFICFVLSFSLFYFAESNKKLTKNAFWFLSCILILYWTLLIGLQYNVGTDYPTYYRMFYDAGFAESQHNWRNNNEPLFFHMAGFIASSALPPQSGFVITALIKASLFFVFIKKFEISKPSIFILLFFTVATIFVNQTNLIRQAIAVYIFSLSIYFVLKRKFIFFCLTVYIASMFHRSALFMLPIFFVPILIKKLNAYHFIIMLFVSLFLSTRNFFELIEPIIILTPYAAFLDASDHFFEPVALVNRLTRYAFIPFYLLSLRSLHTLNDVEKKLFHIGFVFYCFRLILLSLAAVNRLSIYFEIVQLFPLYFMMVNFMNANKKKAYSNIFMMFVFLSIIIGMQAGRTLVFPTQEYDYRSILSRIKPG